jgi:ATP-dependent DNA helicase DinG
MSASSLAEAFATDGPLAANLEGYGLRQGQLAMAAEVAAAIAEGDTLVVEAGTGTGKTFAYLIPALLSGRRVIVSTGTRALQDQLFHRDLPTVSRALGRPVRVALLKGRANYLCRHRLELAESVPVQGQLYGGERALSARVARMREWSLVTRRGDIAELPDFAETDPVWSLVTSTRENCLGSECPRFEDCCVLAARREAQAADLVVVNHHLLIADLMLKEGGFGDLLPGADAVVIDEAHQWPDVAAQFLGWSVGTRQIGGIVRDLGAELLAARQDSPGIAAAMARLEASSVALVSAGAGLPDRLERERWPDALHEALAEAEGRCGLLLEALGASAGEDGGLHRIVERLMECRERLATLGLEELPEAAVRWVEGGPRQLSAHYAPIDVAGQLCSIMRAQGCGWILTSATLAVGEDFGHFKRRSGLEHARAIRFPSPFDFAGQARLYLPTGLGDPAAPGHTRAVVAAALPVLEASGGRAFLLFTSHRALREGAQALRDAWGDSPPVPVLVQGEEPRDRMLRRFRAAGNAVLLGTGSFWEGVDVKGTALTVVVIDKLPFAAPDDPLLRARLEAIRARGGNPFFEEQVPQAVIALKQGVGRLVRDPEDFGVVMLCDPRLLTKGYGRAFLDSLPPMRRTRDLAEVTGFLRERLATA